MKKRQVLSRATRLSLFKWASVTFFYLLAVLAKPVALPLPFLILYLEYRKNVERENVRSKNWWAPTIPLFSFRSIRCHSRYGARIRSAVGALRIFLGRAARGRISSDGILSFTGLSPSRAVSVLSGASSDIVAAGVSDHIFCNCRFMALNSKDRLKNKSAKFYLGALWLVLLI